MSEEPSYEEIVRALRMRLARSPGLRDMPAGDIADDLLDNSHLPTKPDPELITRALEELREEEA